MVRTIARGTPVAVTALRAPGTAETSDGKAVCTKATVDGGDNVVAAGCFTVNKSRAAPVVDEQDVDATGGHLLAHRP